MSLAATIDRSTSELPPPGLRRFSVREFDQLVDAGFFESESRVELLEGWIVTKMTRKPPHDAAIDYAQEIIRPLLPPEWRLREQKAITTQDSEPEPDIAIVRGPASRYAKRHPRPDDIALIIEVSQASLFEDRGRKGRIYARARIPVYWIVNLEERQVEVYSVPQGSRSPAYRDRQDFATNDRVPLLVDNNLLGKIRVKDLLP
jgi:Uma2 family endonuclease